MIAEVLNVTQSASSRSWVARCRAASVSAALSLVLASLGGCGSFDDDPARSDEMEMMTLTGDRSTSSMPDGDGLAQQLPLELTLSAAERSEYYSILEGIHEEVNVDAAGDRFEAEAGADPSQHCDRCGRETGFIPSPDLFLTRFIPVEMKDLTLGLASWVVDEILAQEALEELLGDDAPERPDFSYRLTLVRADIETMSEESRALARAGMLLSSNAPEEVSITSVSTSTEETAITFEHGYSYVFSIVAVESNTKLTSAPSAPIMVYCPHLSDESTEERLEGGCVQLIPEEDAELQ